VLPVLIPDRVTLSSPTWSSSKLCVDGDDEVAAVAVSAGTEQSVDPLALEPEEHLAVQQPEPLLTVMSVSAAASLDSLSGMLSLTTAVLGMADRDGHRTAARE
jgi:hypothetical protein